MKTLEELRTEAAAIASAFRTTSANEREAPGTAIDRDQLTARKISPTLRDRFIAFRTELCAHGIYDPVLGTFDSATVQQAGTDRIAQQLDVVAEKLQSV